MTQTDALRRGLPRASGGVSINRPAALRWLASSPRKRGCFLPAEALRSAEHVFPAQAGVFPHPSARRVCRCSLPRASGGVSLAHRLRYQCLRSSPRKRGCFLVRVAHAHIDVVFPAQAGVFPAHSCRKQPLRCLPRASGGVSSCCRRFLLGPRSSPRKRGCFQQGA